MCCLHFTEENWEQFFGSNRFKQPGLWQQNDSLCHRVHRGSAIAKIVGANAAKYDKFDTEVNMWVFEETVNGRKLTEIINTDHENVKYLPGHKLPPNVVSFSPGLFIWSRRGQYIVFYLFADPVSYPDSSFSSGCRSRLGRVRERSWHPDLCGPSPVHCTSVWHHQRSHKKGCNWDVSYQGNIIIIGIKIECTKAWEIFYN